MSTEIKAGGSITSGIFWKVLENGGTQGVQFLVSIVLARLVAPEEYTSVALITIFIAIANVLIQNSFNTALIQNRDVTAVDYSSVFYLNLLTAGILYLLLYVTAPFIAAFYRIPELSPMLRVLAVTLFFGAAISVQNAIVARTMNFKKLCIASFVTAVLSGVVGISMAYGGYGVWALVAQQFLNSLLLMLTLGILVAWHPILCFSMERIKVLFSFGWKLLCSGFIDTIYTNVYGLVIGKIYNPAMLAYYNRGNQFPLLIANNLGGAIQSVMLPAYSMNQDDRAKIKQMVKRTIVTASFVMFPLMAGMMAVAEPMIRLMLTERWMPVVPFLRLLCISYALWPIHVANLQAMNALGRSDQYLKLEIIKKVLGIISLIATMPFGVYAMVLVKTLMEFVCFFINAYPNRKLLNYSFWEQCRDIMPAALASAVMGILVYGIGTQIESTVLALAVQILCGIILYAGIGWVTHMTGMQEIRMVLRKLHAGSVS
ncbi:MAG: lipopolysaccharide biosynthesis protein [Hungatella sp.]